MFSHVPVHAIWIKGTLCVAFCTSWWSLTKTPFTIQASLVSLQTLPHVTRPKNQAPSFSRVPCLLLMSVIWRLAHLASRRRHNYRRSLRNDMEGQQMYMCVIRLNAHSSNSLLDDKIVFNVKYTCCTIFLSLSGVRVEGKLKSIVAGCMQGNYMQTLTTRTSCNGFVVFLSP